MCELFETALEVLTDIAEKQDLASSELVEASTEGEE